MLKYDIDNIILKYEDILTLTISIKKDEYDKDYIYLDLIIVKDCFKNSNKGIGSKFLTDLKLIADNNNTYITLTAEDIITDINILKKFYTKNGFTYNNYFDFLTGNFYYISKNLLNDSRYIA